MLPAKHWELLMKEKDFMTSMANALLEQGRQEGRQERSIELALALLKDQSIGRKKILKYTGLTESQLREAEEAAAKSRGPEGLATG